MAIVSDMTPKRGPGRPVNEAIRTRREEEILEAAGNLFAERGYSDASTQELADLLHVGKGTIYRYFPTKRALFLATVDRMMRLLDEAIARAIAGFDDPLQRMAIAVHVYLRYFSEHPQLPELLIQERAQFKDRKKPTYFVYHDAHLAEWQGKLQTLIAARRLRDVPVERITEVFSDLLYGTMFTNYFARRQRSPDDQARDLLDIAYHGMLSETERERRPAEDSTSAPAGGAPSCEEYPCT
jgi:AcrR family transcriptional regulator